MFTQCANAKQRRDQTSIRAVWIIQKIAQSVANRPVCTRRRICTKSKPRDQHTRLTTHRWHGFSSKAAPDNAKFLVSRRSVQVQPVTPPPRFPLHRQPIVRAMLGPSSRLTERAQNLSSSATDHWPRIPREQRRQEPAQRLALSAHRAATNQPNQQRRPNRGRDQKPPASRHPDPASDSPERPRRQLAQIRFCFVLQNRHDQRVYRRQSSFDSTASSR